MDQRLHGGILNYEEQTSGEYLDYSGNINPLGGPDLSKRQSQTAFCRWIVIPIRSVGDSVAASQKFTIWARLK